MRTFTIAITATGTMARVLATRAISGGHDLRILGRDAAAKAAEPAGLLGGKATAGTAGSTPPAGEPVFLAVPYAATVPVASRRPPTAEGRPPIAECALPAAVEAAREVR